MISAAVCWTSVIFLVITAIITAVVGHQLKLPTNFTALGGNLRVTLNLSDTDTPTRLQLVRMTGTAMIVLGSSTVYNNSDVGVLPCAIISKGGHYGVRLIRDNDTDPGDLSQLVEMDVRWPQATVSMDTEHVVTYPNQSVTGMLEFKNIRCRYLASAGVPEFSLDLLYCGHTPLGCAETNATQRQVLHSEQVKGYPRRRLVTLGCELFGLDGYYALTLRATAPTSMPVNITTFLKASWSDKFVFNVYARSIFPCDAHSGGVETVFQYPACRLPGSGDRVRLFARLRADVSSLQPPTSLHYISEQRVASDQHHLHFDCDLFSEKYVEYCFVYVSQAVTGAMADVRMDCVPTLPVTESDSGGWGAWSSWTPCTTTCPGGVKNRYRICDSPPPRYGAKFCDGRALESQQCGGHGDVWDCPFDPSAPIPANRPEVLAEVGPGCRCGCVVHLGVVKPRRVLATSAQSCPGRKFWMIQAETGHVIRLSIEHLRLPCESQVLKLRDGDSLNAQLIAQLSGSPRGPPALITSSGNYLLMEFYSEEITCGGGFLAHAQQIPPQIGNWTDLIDITVSRAPNTRLSLVHAAVLLFICIVFLLTAALAAQYLIRYRKYNLAVADLNNRSRATSRATLLSDVISLARGVAYSRHHATLVEEESEQEYELVGSYDPADEVRIESSSARDTSASETEHVRPNIGLLTGRPKKIRKAEVIIIDDDKDHNSRPTSSISSRRISIRTGSASASATSVGSTSSVATLTNGGIASPALSVNLKEGKDKRNLERLLQGATSEFSLGGPDASDLELDYYDYNVSNAGAVPGSFLGMDPAYLVWIPPFAPGCWDTEDDLLNLAESSSIEHEMQEFSNRGQDTPTDVEQITDLGGSPHLDNKRVVEVGIETSEQSDKVRTAPAKGQHRGEKETRVEKSPGGEVEYYDLMNDIKFADDEEDDGTDTNHKPTPKRKRQNNIIV